MSRHHLDAIEEAQREAQSALVSLTNCAQNFQQASQTAAPVAGVTAPSCVPVFGFGMEAIAVAAVVEAVIVVRNMLRNVRSNVRALRRVCMGLARPHFCACGQSTCSGCFGASPSRWALGARCTRGVRRARTCAAQAAAPAARSRGCRG
jgi:hypothetical protein